MPITSTKHDHLIQQLISHHVLTISHHNMPCKNKLDVLYFVVASFTWLLWALSKNQSHLRIKTTTIVCQIDSVLTFARTGRSHIGSTKVGGTVARKPPMCKPRRENRSRVSVRVMLVRVVSSNNTAEPKYDMLVGSMTCIVHNSLVFYSCK